MTYSDLCKNKTITARDKDVVSSFTRFESYVFFFLRITKVIFTLAQSDLFTIIKEMRANATHCLTANETIKHICTNLLVRQYLFFLKV